MIDPLVLLAKIGKTLSKEDLALHTQYFLDAKNSLETAVKNGSSDYLSSDLVSSYKRERDILVLNFMPVVVSRAKYYAKNADQVLDYASEGVFGILKGLNTYDASRGALLTTHVFRCITTIILDYLRRKKRENIDLKGGSIEEIDELNELLPDKKGNEDEGVVNKDSEKFVLDRLEDILNPTELKIIKGYYGIGEQKKDPRKIADELNISYMAVRVRKCSILKKLRKHAEQIHLGNRAA